MCSRKGFFLLEKVCWALSVNWTIFLSLSGKVHKPCRQRMRFVPRWWEFNVLRAVCNVLEIGAV